jgi:hypothetical protein
MDAAGLLDGVPYASLSQLALAPEKTDGGVPSPTDVGVRIPRFFDNASGDATETRASSQNELQVGRIAFPRREGQLPGDHESVRHREGKCRALAAKEPSGE